jgi:hypothetical protein
MGAKFQASNPDFRLILLVFSGFFRFLLPVEMVLSSDFQCFMCCFCGLGLRKVSRKAFCGLTLRQVSRKDTKAPFPHNVLKLAKVFCGLTLRYVSRKGILWGYDKSLAKTQSRRSLIMFLSPQRCYDRCDNLGIGPSKTIHYKHAIPSGSIAIFRFRVVVFLRRLVLIINGYVQFGSGYCWVV